MSDELFSLVQECSNKYSFRDIDEKEVEIRIRIPKKFYSLWLVKLSDLRTTEKEIKDCMEEDNP